MSPAAASGAPGAPGAPGAGESGESGKSGDRRIGVMLNGEDRDIPAGLTVGGLLEHLDLVPGMVVVERNREILDRERYGDTPVEEGDTLELVHFVGGG